MALAIRVPLGLVVAGTISLSLTASRAELQAQGVPPTLQQERGDLTAWLAEAPLSPFAAVALHPIGPGLTIGVAPADIPLAEFGSGTVNEKNGLAILTVDGRHRSLPRGRPVAIGPYTLLTAGARGRATLAVFGAPREAKRPTYYPYRGDLVASAALEPPERAGPFVVLGLDGLDTQAVEAGFLRIAWENQEARLRVYRLGEADDDEAALFVFFQDPTNGKGSYPAGRFVDSFPRVAAAINWTSTGPGIRSAPTARYSPAPRPGRGTG